MCFDTCMQWIASYLIAAVVFGVLDFLWLGKVGRGIYQEHIGHLLAPKPNMTAAIIFYAIYLVGITYFATIPALDAGSLGKAAVSGALLGFVGYATWNLTNLSVLKDYPSSIVPIDMAWGTVATGVTAVITYAVVRALPFGGGS